MSYIPHLFIGIGETHAFFTLRETYQHYVPGSGPMGNAVVNGVYQGTVEIRSRHLYNLSQDASEAFSKATEAADALGLRLSSTRESITAEMRDILRASAEVLAERARASAEQEARWAAQRAVWEAERVAEEEAFLAAGRVPFGKYKGNAFTLALASAASKAADLEADVKMPEEARSVYVAPRGFLSWLVASREKFGENSIQARTAARILALAPEALLAVASPSRLVGAEGERREFSGEVIRAAWFDSDFGRVYVTTIVEKGTEACLVVKSGAWAAEEGEAVTFKATVKKHDIYKGQAQTVLARVAETKDSKKARGTL